MDTRMAGLSATEDRARLDLTDAESRVGTGAFWPIPILPDGPGPAFLLVALRPAPTMQHYDPEAVDYWVTDRGRGERRTLTHGTPMPQSEDFAWGLIRLIDRLGVSNEYLTFGGHLDAVSVDDLVVGSFVSPAPLLRRGGHSRGFDPAADAMGAFFGRLMVPASTARPALKPSLPKPIRSSVTRHSSATAWIAGAAAGARGPVDDELVACFDVSACDSEPRNPSSGTRPTRCLRPPAPTDTGRDFWPWASWPTAIVTLRSFPSMPLS